MNALIRVLFAISIISIGASAQAVVVAFNDPTVVGNGNTPDDLKNLSFDTSTDFEWLDPSLSTGYTYNYVDTQLGPGGLFAGFQRASNADVLQLFTNLGLSSGSFPNFTDVADGGVLADAAIDLLSDTGTTPNFRFTQAVTTDITTPGNHRVVYVRHNIPATVTTTAGNGGLGDATGGAQIGHWLYRDRSPVPEPSSLIITLMAVTGSSVLRWRRRPPLG